MGVQPMIPRHLGRTRGHRRGRAASASVWRANGRVSDTPMTFSFGNRDTHEANSSSGRNPPLASSNWNLVCSQSR